MTPTITGRSTVDELPGPDGRAPLGGDRASTGRLGDRIFGGLAKGAGVLVVAIVALVGTFLVIQAVPALLNNNVNFLTSREWVPSGAEPRFGILDMFWATTVTVDHRDDHRGAARRRCRPVPHPVRAPVAEGPRRRDDRPAGRRALDRLRLLGPDHRRPVLHPDPDRPCPKVFGWIPVFDDAGISAKSTLAFAGIILAIMVLPIITAISREVFAQVPTTHKEGALALGATQWEMIRTAVLPFGKPGIISASMLGLGRALGETLAVVILLSGLNSTAGWSWSIFNGGSTFASKIAGGASEFDSPQKTGAYIAAGLVLFVLTFAVNAVARIVIERRKAFTE